MSRAAIAMLCVAAIAGCDRPRIEGVVYNVQGETLPGVAVRVADTDFNALTNRVGEYTIGYRPGEVLIEFYKSGYTPRRLTLDIAEPTPVDASPVQLWRLPPAAGVFLFEDFRYRETTRVEPKEYFLEGAEPIYATERLPTVRTEAAEPVIVIYTLPRYDARLSRLTQTPAKRTASAPEPTDVWAPAGTMRPGMGPIAEEGGALQRLHLDRPLEPGVYAVHWGALEGYTILDSRIHMFRVGPEKTEAEEPSEGSGEDSDEDSENDEAEADAA